MTFLNNEKLDLTNALSTFLDSFFSKVIIELILYYYHIPTTPKLVTKASFVSPSQQCILPIIFNQQQTYFISKNETDDDKFRIVTAVPVAKLKDEMNDANKCTSIVHHIVEENHLSSATVGVFIPSKFIDSFYDIIHKTSINYRCDHFRFLQVAKDANTHSLGLSTKCLVKLESPFEGIQKLTCVAWNSQTQLFFYSDFNDGGMSTKVISTFDKKMVTLKSDKNGNVYYSAINECGLEEQAQKPPVLFTLPNASFLRQNEHFIAANSAASILLYQLIKQDSKLDAIPLYTAQFIGAFPIDNSSIYQIKLSKPRYSKKGLYEFKVFVEYFYYFKVYQIRPASIEKQSQARGSRQLYNTKARSRYEYQLLYTFPQCVQTYGSYFHPDDDMVCIVIKEPYIKSRNIDPKMIPKDPPEEHVTANGKLKLQNYVQLSFDVNRNERDTKVLPVPVYYDENCPVMVISYSLLVDDKGEQHKILSGFFLNDSRCSVSDDFSMILLCLKTGCYTYKLV